ncbi:MAG: DUF4189 domain-containing protein [Pseudanabaenaceae cyanobacterium bins.39]|nr:DUF4189 domain-containing protein [Pseudanabaenaceae cyanobacterium bins.39]
MLIGTVLKNRYKIVKVLGSGGFGDTYLAEDTDLPSHPHCVVKQLKPKDSNPNVLPIAKSLFNREAEYLYRLGNSHPQIPTLFAHFEENGEFFLVEEFIDGHSLAAEIMVGKVLPESTVVEILLEILEVLSFVHQSNIIHRDIKLENLIRRYSDRKIVLIDFGAVKDISVLSSDAQGNTNVTVSIGSPGYMPSEQAMGKPKLSSDVYAVGMIGIQALTGIAPDSLQEDPETGELIWRDRVQISTELANILQTMTLYHFNQRYRSATEALAALQSFNQATVISKPSGAKAAIPIAPTTIVNGDLHSKSNSENSHTGNTNSQNADLDTSLNSTLGNMHENGNTINVNRISGFHSEVNRHISHDDETASESTKVVTHSPQSNTQPNWQTLVSMAVVVIISVSAAIATSILLPKFTSKQANSDVNEKKEAPVTSSPSVPTPESTPSPPERPNRVLPRKTDASFGAIARSPTTRSKGYAWNYDTQNGAEDRSVQECESISKSGDCEVLVSANNACISIAEGTNGAAGTGRGRSPVIAEGFARSVCQKYQGIDCSVTRTFCLPFNN